MTLIYAIFSGRNGKVRYVGQTSSELRTRFAQHQRGSVDRANTVRRWMYKEWADSFPVRMIQLEWCQPELANSRESYWINAFDNLLNERGYYRHRMLREHRLPSPKVQEISDYMRNHIFHVDGRRCIHYRRSIDMYFVMLPSRSSGYYYLTGDELPGGSAAIWFSDLARAETALDLAIERQRQAELRSLQFRPRLFNQLGFVLKRPGAR